MVIKALLLTFHCLRYSWQELKYEYLETKQFDTKHANSNYTIKNFCNIWHYVQLISGWSYEYLVVNAPRNLVVSHPISYFVIKTGFFVFGSLEKPQIKTHNINTNYTARKLVQNLAFGEKRTHLHNRTNVLTLAIYNSTDFKSWIFGNLHWIC